MRNAIASESSAYSQKISAPKAPAATNNQSRPMAPVTLGAAPVGAVKTGAMTLVVLEDLAVSLDAALPPAEVALCASEPELLGVSV